MAKFDITLNQYRNMYAAQDNIRTDPETGIRYATDTMGNPVVIAPTKEIPSKTPGAPSGFEYESMEPESRTFTDPSGKEVTMTETDIRPYLFDPTLIQREADLALLSGKASPDAKPIGTELTIGKDWKDRPGEKKTFVEPETGFTKLMPGVEPESVELPEEEKQKIQAASDRLDQAAGVVPPGGQELPEEGGFDFEKPNAREDYRSFIVQKMGGDPFLINPQEEAMKMMPQSRVQEWYQDNWKDGMKNWYDMSVGDQEQIGAKLRSDLTSQITQELKPKQFILEKAMAEYKKNSTAFFKALKTIRDIGATQRKEERAGAKDEETALYRLNRAQNDKAVIEKKISESFDEAEKANLQARLKTVEEEIRHYEVGAGRSKIKPGAEDKEKPISTEKQAGAKPGWAPANATAWVETAKGKFYKVVENGKEVTYPAKEAK